RASVSPLASAISASRQLPAWETTPLPSAVTFNAGRCLLGFTEYVPSCLGMLESRQPHSPWSGGLFRGFAAHQLPANEKGGPKRGLSGLEAGGDTRFRKTVPGLAVTCGNEVK